MVAPFCFGLLIAVTNAALDPMIQQNKIDKLNDLARDLLPKAQSFVEQDTEIELVSAKGKKQKIKLYMATSETKECVGWCFNASGSGLIDTIELVVAVDKDFEKIAGFDVLACNETPSIGDRIEDDDYRNQFKAAPVGVFKLVKTGDPGKIDSEIVAISGATISSEAVVKIINDSITQIKKQMQQKGLINK